MRSRARLGVTRSGLLNDSTGSSERTVFAANEQSFDKSSRVLMIDYKGKMKSLGSEPELIRL